jgi:hypothetical protein
MRGMDADIDELDTALGAGVAREVSPPGDPVPNVLRWLADQ